MRKRTRFDEAPFAMDSNSVRDLIGIMLAERSQPTNCGNAQFAERRLAYENRRLRNRWGRCPECGEMALRPPTPADLVTEPAATGICAGCGGAFRLDAYDRVESLTRLPQPA